MNTIDALTNMQIYNMCVLPPIFKLKNAKKIFEFKYIVT